VNGVWGGPSAIDPELYVNLPPHRRPSSLFPSGGNQTFIDGSARWIKIDQMRFLTTWDTGAKWCYFYQDRQDFPANLLVRLDASYMVPAP